jgi:amidohydrolase
MPDEPIADTGEYVELTELKNSIAREIDSRQIELGKLSKRIHDNPESGLSETQAVSWLGQYLEDNGFTVGKGICRLPTAFRASYGCGSPVVALLAEYDALPELGHACGHNIIATSAVAAAVVTRSLAERFGGTILVIGTPDEERSGGKIVMLERSAFDGVDAALMVHPAGYDAATTETLACQSLDVEFFGREAHAAANPEAGINALEAMLLSYAAINSLRQHTREGARIHGIITDGGRAANIIPGHSAAGFIVRAEDSCYLKELKKNVINCFAGAASATGARLEYKWAEVYYDTLRNNRTLASLFQHNMASLGRKIPFSNPGKSFFSTDMGNVSQVIPSLHAMVSITSKETSLHTREFARAATSKAGMRGMIDAAKALSMTIADLLARSETVSRLKEDFSKVAPGAYQAHRLAG